MECKKCGYVDEHVEPCVECQENVCIECSVEPSQENPYIYTVCKNCEKRIQMEE